MRPSDVLLAGVALLRPILAPHGFAFRLTDEGRGSGGDYAVGEFVAGDRRLELHFRHSLGLVTYRAGGDAVGHEAYLRALGVPPGTNQYPGFSDDPLEGFRHLSHDLAAYGAEFLAGDAAVLRRIGREVADWRAAETRIRQAHDAGDEAKRAEARQKFRQRDYAAAMALLESIRYPDLLSGAERQMLTVARARATGR